MLKHYCFLVSITYSLQFNERKQPLGVVALPSTRQKGQKLPGFSCQGRTKKSLLHLKSRCAQFPGALWHLLEEKAQPCLRAAAGFSGSSKETYSLLVFVWGLVEQELARKGKPLRWPPPSGLLFNTLRELDKELTDEDFLKCPWALSSLKTGLRGGIVHEKDPGKDYDDQLEGTGLGSVGSSPMGPLPRGTRGGRQLRYRLPPPPNPPTHIPPSGVTGSDESLGLGDSFVLLGNEVLDLLDWDSGGRRCCLSSAGVVSFQNYRNAQVKDNL